jgi:hypothetical protein
MEAPKNQTKMVAPDESKAKLGEDPDLVVEHAIDSKPKPRNIKIRAIREIMVRGMSVKAGKTVMVDEDEAKDFCTEYEGQFEFRGTRMSGEQMPRHKVKRAELVKGT